MRRRGAAILALTLASACAPGREPIADADLFLRVSTGAGEVELGKAFPLTVVRAWSKDLTPEAWSDDLLAPVTVRLVGTSRREDERHVEETRRYAGYAFALDEVTVPAPTLRASPRAGDPSAVRSVSGDRLVLRVRRALDPAAPGAPELPGDPLPEPFPWRAWTIGTGAALAALTLVRVRSLRASRLARRSSAPVASASAVPEPEGPHELALRRIERLRATAPRTSDEVQRWYVEASGLVRVYVSERFGIGAAEMTTEELLAATVTAAPRDMLAEALRGCDLVKFAQHASSAPERAATLASAEGFVRGTTPAGLPAAPGAGGSG
jgi:hypothetical protein